MRIRPARPTRTRLTAACLLAALALGATACSSGSDGDLASTAGGGAAADDEPADGPRALADGLAESVSGAAASGATDSAVADVPLVERKVIATGNVVLRADDVGDARFEVQQVVDRHGGEVAEEETATDDDGEVKRSRMVVRVPTARFDDAVEGLSGVGELVTAQTGSEDVTTKVLDVGIRVRVQRRSIRRIELLLDRAQSIRDIVAIEAQLTRRQAELASLEKQQDYLADQTSMATITVTLQRTVEHEVGEAREEAGFLAGLAAGWDGLVAVAVGAATVTGALVPFAAVALVLAVLGWPLVRRLRQPRRRPAAG